MQKFSDLGLHPDLVRAIAELGFEMPTPIQAAVIPTALSSERDIIALAQTGTGKTAAFGLPLLQLIEPTNRSVQALILCPTRELCLQVASDLEKYATSMKQLRIAAVYGGARIDQQIKKIRDGVQVIVATPGRLIDLIDRKAVKLDTLSRLVLDEADEMLNMGFREALDTILASATQKKSVWLFSATMSQEIRTIAANYMESPTEVATGSRNQTNENIEHHYYICRADDRYAALKRIVDANPGIFGLIFCRTKAETKEIADQMMKDGYNSDTLHGDMSQAERDRTMARFRERSIQLLIATDVAARGLDVNDISHVIQFGLPDDIEVYTHRSGRTGRAGKTGVSITIVTPKFAERIPQFERACKLKMTKKDIPSGQEVCAAQLMQIIQNIHDITVQNDAIEPFLPQIYEHLADLSKEELIQRFASVEFNRFLDYYKNADDLNIYQRNSRQKGSDGSSGKYQRVFANIGKLDGVTKGDFVKLLGDLRIPSRSIGDIDIQKAFMHFDIDPKYFGILQAEMNGAKINGRRVRIDDATERRTAPPKKNKKEKFKGFIDDFKDKKKKKRK
ncbi:MAG: DEAD/DEAH box helicase [Saprospiraceae bacterium]|nr:DEAD/DEAH box helicase [Saprospiraceae bacterium]MBP7679556.1 DEAD/DEAH box helicase [Saprospiraceae bacterium]